MRLTLLLLIVSLPVISPAQANRTRTRTIDYTEYDKLAYGMYAAQDKRAACDKLLKLTLSLFTEEDEEFFSTHNTLGNVYEGMLMDPPKAMQHFRSAVDAYEKHFPFYHRGYALVNQETGLTAYLGLARIYNQLSLFEKSLAFLQTHKDKLEATSPAIRSDFYRRQGDAYLGLGRYDEAIEVATKWKNLTESGVFEFKSNADDVYKINPNDPKETQDAIRKAKETYEKAMRDAAEMTLLNQRIAYNTIFSKAYFNQFRYSESIPFTESWINDYTKMYEGIDEAVKKSYAMVDQSQLKNEHRQAIEDSKRYMQALKEVSGTNTLIIIAAMKAGQPEVAAKYAQGWFDKAVHYQLSGNFTGSEQAYQSAFALLKSISATPSYANVESMMKSGFMPTYINLQVKSGNLDNAHREMFGIITAEENNLKRNFQFFSESEKKEFFKGYSEKLERYYSLLIHMTENKLPREQELLNKVLQTKGIVLDVTREQERRLRRIKDKSVIQLIRKVRDLRDKLAAYYQIQVGAPTPALSDSISRLSIAINELERKANEKLGLATDFFKPIDWKDIQKKLKPGEVYLEIVRIKRDNFSFDKPETQYWAFAIKPGVLLPEFFQLSQGESMDGRGLKNYQNRIKGRLDDNDSFETYWAKIDSKIPDAKNILLSADGAYHMINPLTLKNPRTGKYLLNEISLSRISTGRDLLTPHDPSVSSKEIALISNPTFDMSRRGTANAALEKDVDHSAAETTSTRGGFALLPGTKKESDIIQTLANQSGMKSKSFEGTSASESNVKSLAGPQILHFATHGEFDHLSKVDSYLKSKLILAGADDKEPFSLSDYGRFEDGFLTAYEVTQMDLANNELVVLSACETGLGEIQSGEGVWGLQRAFQLAGAKTVMGSLWKISDEATVTFMESFYRNYLAGSGLAVAYKTAMETTLARYPHPYYWGAFTLTGKD